MPRNYDSRAAMRAADQEEHDKHMDKENIHGAFARSYKSLIELSEWYNSECARSGLSMATETMLQSISIVFSQAALNFEVNGGGKAEALLHPMLTMLNSFTLERLHDREGIIITAMEKKNG